MALARGGRAVIADLSFTIDAGRVLRLSGGNGTGKSTLLKALAGLLRPVAGSVHWVEGDGAGSSAEPIHAARAVPLYIGHLPALRDDLTAAENLRMSLALDGDVAAEDALGHAATEWRLDAFWRRPARELSMGQRRRVALARLSISRKPLWLLDEPYTALDAQGADTLRSAIGAHRARGGVVAYASHDAHTPGSGDDACLSLEAASRAH